MGVSDSTRRYRLLDSITTKTIEIGRNRKRWERELVLCEQQMKNTAQSTDARFIAENIAEIRSGIHECDVARARLTNLRIELMRLGMDSHFVTALVSLLNLSIGLVGQSPN